MLDIIELSGFWGWWYIPKNLTTKPNVSRLMAKEILLSSFPKSYLVQLGNRLWRKVDRSSHHDCWVWTGAKGKPPRHYGSIAIKMNGHRTTVLTHRLVYALHHGETPSDVEICHKCDNPSCCNPKHLFAGTRADNMQDMVKKGRHVSLMSPEKIKKGSERAFSKLTDESVKAIRLDHLKGASMQGLSRKYGVAFTTIRDIVNRTKWKHVA
jgi:predicted DNA-binding protein (UPF0251 family)